MPITLHPPVKIDSFASDAAAVAQGGSYTLNWASTDAASCTLDDAAVAVSGSQIVTAAALGAKSHALRCVGVLAYDTLTRNVSVTVEEAAAAPVEITAFTVAPAAVTLGQAATLSWTVEHATGCTASGDWSGSKAAAGGSESVTPAMTGTKTYTLTCTDGTAQSVKSVTLPVTAAATPPSFTAALSASPTSITVGQSATLNWTAANASSCMASGAWAGSRSLTGTETVTPSAAGTYSYTLTCSGDGPDAVSSTTLTVNASSKSVISLTTGVGLNGSEIQELRSDLVAGKEFYYRTVLTGFGSTERCFTAFYPVGGSPTYVYAGTVSTRNSSARAVVSPTVAGGYLFELACGGTSTTAPDLVNGASKAVPITLHPLAKIDSFASDAATVAQGGSYTLSWASTDAASCTLDGAAVGTSGGQGFTLGADDKTHTLVCQAQGAYGSGFANSQTKTLTVRKEDADWMTEVPTGRWFGQYTFLMSQADEANFILLGLANRLPGTWPNQRYKTMGLSYVPAYWMWDFDELAATGTGKIYLGSSMLLAMGAIRLDYRLFSPSRPKQLDQTKPQNAPPLSEHLGTFTRRSDGTYDVRFNLQIFFELVGYPYLPTANIMSLRMQDGGLVIRHEDGDADGRNMVAIGKAADPNQRALDGIPGVVVDGLFPAWVSPSFSSPYPLVKVGTASCSGDGIPDEVKVQLGLDPCLSDNDGDGISDVEEIGPNWALPYRKGRGDDFRDNLVYDVLQPKEFVGKPDFVGLIALGNREKVVLYFEPGEPGSNHYDGNNPIFSKAIPEDWFGRTRPFYAFTQDAGQQLPTKHPTTNATMNYGLGMLVFNNRIGGADGRMRMYFANGVPEGLTLFRLEDKDQVDIDYAAQRYTRVTSYAILAHQKIDAHTIEFDNPKATIGQHVHVALGHTETNRVVATFDKTEPGYQALLAKAAGTVPPEPEQDPITITTFAPSPASVTLGGSVQLQWVAANATSCAIREGGNLLSGPALALSGSFTVTPSTAGLHSYELVCSRGSDSLSKTAQVQVNSGTPPVDPNAITGTWTGTFDMTMRTAPQGQKLGDSLGNAWTWNFDEGWAEMARGMLSVGFEFHVQDVGDLDKTGDRAYFTSNGDGTYTLHHGFQIYNPSVGNPRTDIFTTVRITRSGNQLAFTTVDSDNDGVPGVQVPGVFPLTVSPALDGVAQESTSPGPVNLLPTFTATPASIKLGESATLAWQAGTGATGCTASGAWSGAKAVAGGQSVLPAATGTHTYMLACTDGTNTTTRSASVVVTATTAPQDKIDIKSFAASESSVKLGASVSLAWQVVNANGCSISQGSNLYLPNLPISGSIQVTPASVGTHSYQLMCVSASEQMSRTASVQVTQATTPGTPNPGGPGAAITGTWTGTFNLTMRTAPEGIKLGDSHDNAWTWNFDEGWAEMARGMLSVGFEFHVQDVGNASASNDRAYFTSNGDGTYTLNHGFQIYNPNVGNPRTDIYTTFRITRNGNQLTFSTVDTDNDGVPGVQVPGVFPLTVSPGFDGVAQQQSGPVNPGNLVSAFTATPASIKLGESSTLAWQAASGATGCTASGAWSGAKATAGGQAVMPATTGTHTYTLACTDGTNTSTRSVSVVVTGSTKPVDAIDIKSFAPSEASVKLGASVRLSWQVANANSCAISEGDELYLPGLPIVGGMQITPVSEGSHTYKLLCVSASEQMSRTTTVLVKSASGGGGTSPGTPTDPSAVKGTWKGTFSLTMRVAESGTVLGDSHGNAWTWNFTEGWVEMAQGMLSVGFPFHVQDVGNADADGDRAYFTSNGDGTYTLQHGFQIYNPYVGNPRTDMSTTFRVTIDGDGLKVSTLDPDGDGVPGLPVPNVFPLTVSPGFDGVLTKDGTDPTDPTDPTNPNTGLIGLFQASSASVAKGGSVTLTWQAVRAESCTASGDWTGTKAKAGTESVKLDTARSYAFTLTCKAGTETKSSTVTVTATGGGTTNPGGGGGTDPADPDNPGDAGTASLTGVFTGQHMVTMRGCPAACAAGKEVVLGTGMKNSPWVWDFDKKTVLITGTTLTVGFNYEVQSVGNKGSGDARLTAPITDNGDGTYTVHHGFQIYNPNVGNPRADTVTTFRITRDATNKNLLRIVTLDGEADGIPGTQIVGVFPMTIQPDFRGTARKEGSSSGGDGIPDSVKERLGLNPDAPNADTDGDGIPDATELGDDLDNPLDSDGDGVIDALEPGNAAQDARRIAGLALLDGIPGRLLEAMPNAGTAVGVQAGNVWLFTGAETGLMQVTATGDNGGAIPDVTLGDAGLDYKHGFVQVRMRSASLLPASGAAAAVKAAYAPAAAPMGAVTLTYTFESPLPAAGKLLVYATTIVDGKERYTLLDKGEWTRVDNNTLTVTVQDNGPHDMNPDNGLVRLGIAPAENTLGGHEGGSGNASGGGKGGSMDWLLLAVLGLLALGATASRRAVARRAG
ncbi:hypothetical protein YS110_06295 [Acidovorax sp. YS12]|nr:hypothetical protein YS110_06295 [Acidovorax sp. YS12]